MSTVLFFDNHKNQVTISLRVNTPNGQLSQLAHCHCAVVVFRLCKLRYHTEHYCVIVRVVLLDSSDDNLSFSFRSFNNI